MSGIPSEIEHQIEIIRENLVARFQDDLVGLVLYGSWAKGTARKDSDIDLLAVFCRIDRETERSLYDIAREAVKDRDITIVPSSLDDFQKESVPFYTAAKREGKLIYGRLDLSVNPAPPHVKYAGFFKRSFEFESQKIEMAEQFYSENHLTAGLIALCFVAAKHAIQAALAMRGEGYSSKVAILLPLAEQYFGREIADEFEELFRLYIKFEYGMEWPIREEAGAAIGHAKAIQKVYASPSGCGEGIFAATDAK